MSHAPGNRSAARHALRAEALRFVGICLLVSALMAALKIGVGLYSGSHALMVNAVYSVNDVLSSIAVAISLRVGYRRPNPRYPYGYGKAEFIAAGLVSITIALFVSFLVVYSLVGVVKGAHGPPHAVAVPLAGLSLGVSWVIARKAHRLAHGLSSPALETTAEHFQSDAGGSLAAIVGIAGATLGLHALDPIVALLEELHLMALSGTLLGKCTRGLMDEGLPAEDAELVERAARGVRGVREIAYLRSRRAGSETWVDLGVVVQPQAKISQTAQLAEQLSVAVRSVLGPGVITQVQCRGPGYAFLAPVAGGSQHE